MHFMVNGLHFYPTKRGEFLRAIGDQLKQNAELLGTIETRDTGKMFKETKFQANYIAEFYYYYAGLADKIEGSTLPIDKPDMQVFHYKGTSRSSSSSYTMEFSTTFKCY